MSIIHYETDFTSLIKDTAVVDFYATWCGPCKMFAPVFEEVSNEIDINFIKVDVDANSDLAREYGVMSIPTIILFKDGKECDIQPVFDVSHLEKPSANGKHQTYQQKEHQHIRTPDETVQSVIDFSDSLNNLIHNFSPHDKI